MTSKPYELEKNAQAFVQAAKKVAKATSTEDFLETLREGYLYLHSRLTHDKKGLQASALRKAFGDTRQAPDVRMALELCAMPIFEKPLLPATEGELPEFLWIFALPIVITFPGSLTDQGPFVWDEAPVPAESILEVLDASGRFDPRASLRMFTSLYTRSDILNWGPENMALHVLNAEISEAECPSPLPLQFSSELSGYRSLMFLALGAARAPIGVKAMISPIEGRADLARVEKLMAAHLNSLNIPYESISVAAPCPVTASCFVSNPVFLQQVREIALAAKQAWVLTSVFVKFPMPGYIEIVGRLESGNEVVLMPAEYCCEPRKEVSKAIERVLSDAGLIVTAASVSMHSRVAAIH